MTWVFRYSINMQKVDGTVPVFVRIEPGGDFQALSAAPDTLPRWNRLNAHGLWISSDLSAFHSDRSLMQ
ncbi:hypothetical protein METUNv1_01961 [Methyloversatilis universalis FAM5]|uniref:Uncharacterized protein n=1 Tax=Methyloversatilis universalis (strain ATCC BAA-1314 / DSM 25237 / JCM 13912 / CCUG 52030 / FAM5) TaxID=1000565 RepID=F5RCF4_METUF|nr:hypothetical protein METUNv1_01961 [Methyloversatilis universalis FAM5]